VQADHRGAAGARRFPLLFSELPLRGHALKNRIVFPPTCPSWVSAPQTAQFNDLAAPYYEERASGGVGLIIIGGTHVHRSSIAAPLAQPGLWDDAQIEGFAKVAEAVHRHGAKLAVQLRHTGVRGFPAYKQDPGYDLDATWYTMAPSQVPLGEFPGGHTPKELSGEEIEEILDCHASAARRAIEAGLDGVEFHLSHGYLSWQFLSPLYNKRSDEWGGSYQGRLRFSLEALRRMRAAIGPDAFLGFRINSTSLWPGDLEEADVLQIVQDLQAGADVDFVDVSVGVHHQFIHAPMHFEGGWEREYAAGIRAVSTTPVFAVGRITTPEVAEELLASGAADAIGLARQLFADPDWVMKVAEGRSQDIRRCVAANHCWKSVSRGQRVQCVYNPAVGRERHWGKAVPLQTPDPKRILVAGAGPAGLEFARIAARRGHAVSVYEKNAETGGHVRLQSLLPGRGPYREIARWLTDQAGAAGAAIHTGIEVSEQSLARLCQDTQAGHVVVATGSRVCRDGFQGWTGAALPGADLANCVGWDEVVTGQVQLAGDVLVLDDQADLVGPLIAVHAARSGAASVRLVTRWPMVASETVADAYLEWIMPQVYESGVLIQVDHFVARLSEHTATLYNIYAPGRTFEVAAGTVVMATARQSVNGLAAAARRAGLPVTVIGDAIAPRGTFEAVFEGHRHGRDI
jgi:2,4-dienoyl-CoA reductase-like NADH-dependent reductase (Old Yellow Enzyme family)